MRRKLLTALLTLMCSGAFAIETVPIKGSIISPTDKFIQYAGRISFANPERPAWYYPGIQIVASFEGTSLRMIAKPRSGYFVAQIDQAEPFKVAFRGERDSVVTLATALPDGVHTVRLMPSRAMSSSQSSGALCSTRAKSWWKRLLSLQERSNSSVIPSLAVMATKDLARRSISTMPPRITITHTHLLQPVPSKLSTG